MVNTVGTSLRLELGKIVPADKVQERIDQYHNARQDIGFKAGSIHCFLSFVKFCEAEKKSMGRRARV